MGELKTGQSVGTWQSAMGQATITVKQEIGKGYANQEAAAKAAFGKQSVITQEGDGKFHAYAIDDGAYLDDLNLGEKVAAKSPTSTVKVVDFVGDDGYQLKAGKKVFPPLAPDNGKVVYFMRYLDGSALDRHVLDNLGPQSNWTEEINQARKKGYTVIMDPVATSQDMQAAFYDPRTAGVVFFGHGDEKGVKVGYEGGGKNVFRPGSLEAKRVSPHLKLVVFQSCDTALNEAAWKEVTNGAKIDGWKRGVYLPEIVLNNNPTIAQTIGTGVGIPFGPAGMLAGHHLAGKVVPHRLDKLIGENL